MKTIGLIGGMSWESTTDYYKIVNRTVKQALGGFHSAKCVLYSVDFAEIEACQSLGDWTGATKILGEAAASCEAAGADFIVICTNTMHKVADGIAAYISIPILHIAEVTADELERQGITKVALLGTKYTMEQEFYKNRLIGRGIEVLIPDAEDRQQINDVIFKELCVGEQLDSSKQRFLEIIEKMIQHGAQGIILGCTEIGMLIQQSDTAAMLFDTTEIHARQATLFALE
ncbi:aspartate/glutamate racemase family protein [Oscillospiraceae bacterium PP1C4]